MNIGITIKQLRMKRNVLQQGLAEKVGVSQSYLSLVEKGLREPGLDLVVKIANFLKVPQQLIFLMSCKNNTALKAFEKPIRNITLALDEILRKI